MLHWIYLLLSGLALALAMTTARPWVLALALLAAFGLFLAWGLAWYRSRVGDNQRDEMSMIDPLELRRLRELAEARKREASASQSGNPQQ
jgi:hypothetical protein